MTQSDSCAQTLCEWQSLGEVSSPQWLRERGLLLSALSIPYQIYESENSTELWVRTETYEYAREQLNHFEQENLNWPPQARPARALKLRWDPAVALSGFLVLAFYFQNLFAALLPLDRGASSSDLFQTGDYWRPMTALFLHADLGHLLSNLVAATLLMAVLSGLLGVGLASAGFLLSGTIGNFLNAYFYRSVPHHSIGFSTAVFGAAGIWAGYSLIERLRDPASQVLWRRLLVPLGAAIAYLGMWGSSPESDHMAHFWGLWVGLAYGLVVGFFWADRPPRARVQTLLGFGTVLLILGAWRLALL